MITTETQPPRRARSLRSFAATVIAASATVNYFAGMKWVLAAALAGLPASAAILTPTDSIPLPNVRGRIDHFAIDQARGRLFVAALGQDTVEVIDLKARKVVHTIAGLSEPQGLFYAAEFNRLYVANGGDGALRTFDGATFAAGPEVKFDADADNVRYDPKAKLIYVGYGSGALGIVDANTNHVVGTIPLDAHPESFQLERFGSRVFVNVPGAHAIVVADRETRKVVGQWSLGLVAANFPMALDDAHHLAFVGCRTPARLLVYDTTSGQEIAKLDLHGDCDDVFFDSARHRVYASCGAGYIDVFTQQDRARYSVDSVTTQPKARTCCFDGRRIYLALPSSGQRPAEIEVFDIAN